MRHPTADPPDTDRITTYQQADRVGPYRHAAWIADPNRPPLAERTAGDVLQELARAESLITHLARTRGCTVHAALHAGASPASVAEALGWSIDQVRATWIRWARGQRELHDMTGTGMSHAEYEHVAGLLAGGGER